MTDEISVPVPPESEAAGEVPLIEEVDEEAIAAADAGSTNTPSQRAAKRYAASAQRSSSGRGKRMSLSSRPIARVVVSSV